MKTFVVAVSWEDYDLAIATHRLNPGETFYAVTIQEAQRDVARNARRGIESRVLVTAASQAQQEGIAA